MLTGRTELLARNDDDSVSGIIAGHLFTSFHRDRSVCFPNVFVGSLTLCPCSSVGISD